MAAFGLPFLPTISDTKLRAENLENRIPPEDEGRDFHVSEQLNWTSHLDKIDVKEPVTTLGQFLSRITQLWSIAGKDEERFYFRGQYSGIARDPSTGEPQESEWKLTPLLARILAPEGREQGRDHYIKNHLIASCGDARDGTSIQSILLQRLKRLAEQHYPSVALSGQKHFDFFNWLSIAQHHKVPTYLMDCTINPLVGLYFAVDDAFQDTDPKYDGDVWVFDLLPLKGRSDPYLECFLHLDELDLETPKNAVSNSRRQAEQRTIERLMTGDQVTYPVAIVPRLTARRLDAQGARFVYWNGTRENNLERYTEQNLGIRPWRRLKKFCWVPAENKRKIAEELALLYRIHPGTMDADLDGYGRFLRWGGS